MDDIEPDAATVMDARILLTMPGLAEDTRRVLQAMVDKADARMLALATLDRTRQPCATLSTPSGAARFRSRRRKAKTPRRPFRAGGARR